MLCALYKGISIPVAVRPEKFFEFKKAVELEMEEKLKSGICLTEQNRTSLLVLDIMNRIWREALEKFLYDTTMERVENHMVEKCQILIPIEGIRENEDCNIFSGLKSFDIYTVIYAMHLCRLMKVKVIKEDDKNGFRLSKLLEETSV